MPYYLKVGKDIFSETEAEIVLALRNYLAEATEAINFNCSSNPVRRFAESVNWDTDLVVTFNYDLLLEAALSAIGTNHDDRILHLHGSLRDDDLVYPNTRKFTDSNNRIYYAERWRAAFDALREHTTLLKIVFIGYSMPPSDYEARGLFNYADWYNDLGHSSYEVWVVNPDSRVSANYDFLLHPPIYKQLKLEEYVGARAQ